MERKSVTSTGEIVSACSGLYYRDDGTQHRHVNLATHREDLCTIGNVKVACYWWGRNFGYGCTSF